VTVIRIYIGDINGDPIAPFCPVPGSTQWYLWADFNANAERYAVRTYFELWNKTGLVFHGSVPTADLLPKGVSTLKLTPVDPVTLNCGNEYEVRNVYVAWETVTTANLSNTTRCDQYQSSKCSKNTGTNKFYIIVPSFTNSCTTTYLPNSVQVTFNGSATGGVTPYTYEWNFGDGTAVATSSSVTHTFNTSSTGQFEVTFKVYDTPDLTSVPPYPGTFGSVSKTLILPRITDCPGPVSQMCTNDPLLILSSLTVITEPSGGTGGYYYSSSNGGSSSYSPGQSLEEFDPSIAGNGTHTLYYLYTLEGCSAICYFDIIVSGPTGEITAQTNVLCYGASTGSATASGSGGVGPYTYSWSTVPVQTTETATGLAAGTYTVTVTDANGCSDTEQVTISQPTALALTSALVTSPILCNGGTATVTIVATGGTAPYSYTFNGVTNETGVFTGVSAGDDLAYSITDANDCGPVTGTIDVTQPTALVAEMLLYKNTICESESVTLTATASGGTGSYTYMWSTGATTQSIIVTPESTSDYTVTITDANKCTDDATATITVNHCSELNVSKITYFGGSLTTEFDWTFKLYNGPDGFGTTAIATATTSGGTGLFDGELLSYKQTYTVCELGLPAGWDTKWKIDMNGDGVVETTIVPYNPDGDKTPPEDIGNRCFDFGDGTGYPLWTTVYNSTEPHIVPKPLLIEVENYHPGGGARTPGYWKNWNFCTNGNQAQTATNNAIDLNNDGLISANERVSSGFALLDDLLPITWTNLAGTYNYSITTCELGVKILNNQDINGVNHANDAAYNLARNLLAYDLNQGAGALQCDIMKDVRKAAIELLARIKRTDGLGTGFNSTGIYLLGNNKKVKTDFNEATRLASILDAYNNGATCSELNAMYALSAPAYSEPTNPKKTRLDSQLVEMSDINVNVYPNPFSTVVKFEIEMTFDSHVKLEIYNHAGGLVKVLLDEDLLQGDVRLVEFDATRYPHTSFLYKITAGIAIKSGTIIRSNGR